MWIPVTSAGRRSGVNWTREKERPSARAVLRAISRLSGAGNVFEQDVAAREHTKQNGFEQRALGDHGRAEGVEDGVGLLVRRRDIHAQPRAAGRLGIAIGDRNR